MRHIIRSFISVLLAVFVLCSSTVSIFAMPRMSFTVSTSWDAELSATLDGACEWLADEGDPLLLFCLGTAGKTAPSALVQKLVRMASNLKGDTHTAMLPYYILNLTFSGYHAQNVLGNNLVLQLSRDTDLAGARLYSIAFSLLALDCNPYEVSTTAKNTPNRLVKNLLGYQNEDGGFRATHLSSESLVSHTALAITALAQHQEQEGVLPALNKALDFLSAQQQTDGSYLKEGQASSVLISQVLVALMSVQIPITDPRFVKGNQNLVDSLLQYVHLDGSFSEFLDQKGSDTATQNAIIALAAFETKKNPYLMDASLQPTSYVQQEAIVTPIETPDFDWITPLFLGCYVLLFLSIIVYLIISRCHVLLYWEEHTSRHEAQLKSRFTRPQDSYESKEK